MFWNILNKLSRKSIVIRWFIQFPYGNKAEKNCIIFFIRDSPLTMPHPTSVVNSGLIVQKSDQLNDYLLICI